MKTKIIRKVLLAICLCSTISVIAQNNLTLPQRVLSLTAGSTVAGSGDTPGLQIGVEYEKFFKRRLSWSVDMVNTIHNDENHMLFSDETGPHGFSSHGTTAGIQIGGKASYYFARTSEWAAGVRLGTMVRRQSTSLSWRQTSGQPYNSPIAQYSSDETPATTYALGGTLNLFGNYTINKKILIGVSTGFQIDTNGDTFFRQLLFTVGRRF